MHKRFIKWNIAQDRKGQAVNVYEDAYGRLFIGSDVTFWFESEFLALDSDVAVVDGDYHSTKRRFIAYSEIQKIQDALRQHRAEFPMY